MRSDGPNTPPRMPEGTRSRVTSPPRDTTSGYQSVWDTAWLRELATDEALLKSELDGADMRDLMDVHEDEVGPPTELIGQMEAQVRATSTSRGAAIVKWQHKVVLDSMVPDL